MLRRHALPDYAELHCRSNFSFLTGASQPEELAARAHALGYAALAITDECSLGGVVRDIVSGLAVSGELGEALAGPVTGYALVYLIEIALLFATMIAIGPLVRPMASVPQPEDLRIGLAGPHGAS